MKKQCLEIKDFPKRVYAEWVAVAKSLGYELISDMLYCQYVECDMTSPEMESLIGFSPNVIINYLRKMGVEIRPVSGKLSLTDDQINKAVRLHKELKLSPNQICKRFGVTRQTIYYYLKKFLGDKFYKHPNHPPRMFSDTEAWWVQWQAHRGVERKELAQKYNCSLGTIRKCVTGAR